MSDYKSRFGRMLRASGVDPYRHPRVQNILDALCQTARDITVNCGVVSTADIAGLLGGAVREDRRTLNRLLEGEVAARLAQTGIGVATISEGNGPGSVLLYATGDALSNYLASYATRR